MGMKRVNVVVDEGLLEDARRLSGEKTYSATITKALEDVVRRQEFANAYGRFAELVSAGDFFHPGYIEERWPEVARKLKKRQKPTHPSAAARS